MMEVLNRIGNYLYNHLELYLIWTAIIVIYAWLVAMYDYHYGYLKSIRS